jgi:hypothetical protein
MDQRGAGRALLIIYPVKANRESNDNLPGPLVINVTQNTESSDISAQRDLLSISVFMPDAVGNLL